MSKIFISYRHSDTPYVSGSIFRRVTKRFGVNSVFKDIDNIRPGVNYKTLIDKAIRTCDLVLVLIGEKWTSVTDKNGNCRLFSDGDLVRQEIEIAIKRQITIIPILTHGVSMPDKGELPDSISELTYYQGLRIRPDPDFENDIKFLLDAISTSIREDDTPDSTTDDNPLADLSDDVVDSVNIELSSGEFVIERYSNNSIQVLEVSSNSYLDVVLPFLRKVIDELRLNISLHVRSTGTVKNTQTLGRQVIQACKLWLDISKDVDPTTSGVETLQSLVTEFLEQNRGKWSENITDKVLIAIEMNSNWYKLYERIKIDKPGINRQIGSWVAKYTGFRNSGLQRNSKSKISKTYSVLFDPTVQE